MKRLYRSKNEKMLAGVCGGLSIYINIDPTLMRLLWVLLFIINPGVLIAYIIAAVIIPIQPEGVFYNFKDEKNSEECLDNLKVENVEEKNDKYKESN
ncbi:phage shock protein C, PspC [Methanococcus vannielii SB]|jgi:phage shock protein C|uniref:Phage shock protein C, PspC n=1 Tax=Methanococcus vannielii (strain ATCC 35089 / DSM 1224 / JCM 13029 / OCM 148 / SB) TaxID=406327 RepID=A6UQ20_METVS|nr:PspC domain-containing protein [Methanococcus vannielii]ABR54592.1 phage shock protein C, PspC [Methanococcus vannielii SB]